ITCSINLHAQYKADNKTYQAVFLDDLCKQLQAHPDHILLDVRSQGEYDDTSSMTSLNFGRLKNSLHIDIRQLPARWRELEQYKNETIFIYCSHSQRSRRASRLLADSGFSNIININGGLTTLYLMKNSLGNCIGDMYVTNTRYHIYTPQDFCTRSGSNAFLLDVRPDSTFKGIASAEGQNAFGVFTGSTNIPLANIAASLSRIPKNKEILIVDQFGDDSPKAADILLNNGFTNVGILFNGLDQWYSTPAEELRCKMQLVKRDRKYNLLSSDEFNTLATKNNDVIIIDVRKAEDFNNQSKQYFRNVGNIRNAVNIPADHLNDHLKDMAASKNKPVVIYSFGGNNDDAYNSARLLVNNGFTNVYVLKDGIFDFRWRAHNVKNKTYLND
ncbi:MAG: rhodanese-like domain-containing protein, partial [Minisyncoccia bacterium]